MSRSAFLEMPPKAMSAFALGGMTPDEDEAPPPAPFVDGMLRRSDWDAMSPADKAEAVRTMKIVD